MTRIEWVIERYDYLTDSDADGLIKHSCPGGLGLNVPCRGNCRECWMTEIEQEDVEW